MGRRAPTPTAPSTTSARAGHPTVRTLPGPYRGPERSRRTSIRTLTAVLLALALMAAACGPDEEAGQAEDPTSPGSPTATATATPSAPADSPTDATSPPPSPPPEAEGPAELRAVWIHLFDDTLKSPASIDRMLDRVADANFNTVIAEVVRRQDAYYESDVLPRTTDPALAEGFDALAHLVEGAHARGLELEAWIPLMPAYHHVYDDLPAPDGWVWTEHGTDAPEAQRWVTRYSDGTWDDHLDPALPAVRDHVAAVAAELARNYDVDAIHLDYLRYVEGDTGYHPEVLDRYRADTGASGVPASDDPRWSAWRRQEVKEMVRQVREAVRGADADMPVTAAVVAAGEGPAAVGGFERTRPYVRFHQDWVGMVEEGLLDAIYPMNYFDEQVYGNWFDQWITFQEELAASTDVLVAGGQAGYLNRPEGSLSQLRRISEGLDGAVLYSFQQTAQDGPLDVLFDLVPEELWRERAPVPARGAPR